LGDLRAGDIHEITRQFLYAVGDFRQGSQAERAAVRLAAGALQRYHLAADASQGLTDRLPAALVRLLAVRPRGEMDGAALTGIELIIPALDTNFLLHQVSQETRRPAELPVTEGVHRLLGGDVVALLVHEPLTDHHEDPAEAAMHLADVVEE